MHQVTVIRAAAIACGLLCVLCAVAAITLFFGWALDGSRPISVMPLLASLALAATGAASLVVRRALQRWVATHRVRVAGHAA